MQQENNVFDIMNKIKIIPVIKIEDASKAALTANALLGGGVKIAEVTYRTKAASDSICNISAKCPEILAGAGTVVNIEQAKEAISCGAKFIVTPAFYEDVVDYCIERNVPVIPGVATPTEIGYALRKKLRVVKLFPAEISGGTKFIKAMSAVYPDLKFVPTGGITAENAADYIAQPNVLAVGGTWIVKHEFIENNQWDIITAESKKALLMLK